MPTTIDILRSLVAVPSVSALSNEPLIDVIAALLEPHGWLVQRLPYTARDGQVKFNVIATPKQFSDLLPDLDLLFVCHTDTVPYAKEWAAAMTLTEIDGNLHGCGSCDVKGSLAGLLSAALQVETSQIPRPIAFALTSEEEVGCIGATMLASSGRLHARRVLVCEPTSMRPGTAGKGYGLAKVTVHGREAHSAFPAKGISAISIAAELMVSIGELSRRDDAPCDRRFSPPHTTFNLGVVQGGTAKNIIAGSCSFLVEWRPLPAESADAGGKLVEQIATRLEAAHAGCRIEVERLRADGGFSDDRDNTLETFGSQLSKLTDRPEVGISFGSEATRFAAPGSEIVVIGPGDMETAHSERECIPIVELEEWTGLIKHLLVHGAIQKTETS